MRLILDDGAPGVAFIGKPGKFSASGFTPSANNDIIPAPTRARTARRPRIESARESYMISTILRYGTGLLVAIALASGPAYAQSSPSTGHTVDPLEALHARIEATMEEAERARQLMGGTDGDLRAMLERRLETKNLQIVEDVNVLAEKVVDAENAGADVAEMRIVVAGYLQQLLPTLRTLIERDKKKIISLISTQSPEDIRDAMIRETTLSNRVTNLVDWYSDYLESTANLDAFGIDAAEHREYLGTRLPSLAEMLADAIALTTRELDDAKPMIALRPDDQDLLTRVRLTELRREMVVSNLGTVAALLDKIDVDATGYKSLALEASGDVSTGVLETDVWTTLLGHWTQNVRSWFAENGLDWLIKILVVIVIVYAALTLSRVVRRIVGHAIANVNLSNLLRRMIVATAANGVLVLGILIALSELGVSVGPVLAGLGIAGIIIGFALQDTLSNFASGMMILIYRPYDVGDLIEAGGELGTVTDMSLVSTVILTIDNQKLVVPNNLIWRGVIRNVTAEKIRRVDMTFGISYEDDIPEAERILGEILAGHERVLDEPESIVKLHSLGESSVDFVVRPWVKTEDYWDVYWDVTREVKLRFDAEGIRIPYPQRDVHVHGRQAREEPERSLEHRPRIEEPVE